MNMLGDGGGVFCIDTQDYLWKCVCVCVYKVPDIKLWMAEASTSKTSISNKLIATQLGKEPSCPAPMALF